jgi:integrase/recombinase XerD
MSATTRAGRVPAPIAEVVTAFREYTIDVRGLSYWTAQTRGDVARRFLAAHAPGGTGELAAVTVEQVHDFFRGEAQRLATMSMGPVLDSMRSFLRFLFAAELHEHDLSGCLPAMTTQRHPKLPRHVPPEVVQALLGSCDRTTRTGSRDYAVLLLLSRLALRANEVARLELEDVHWRSAEITIHSKTGRLDQLPLPTDVGTALADYLQQRLEAPDRSVFRSAHAPFGPMSRNAIVFVPRTASARAGVPLVGAHQLRHTTATGLLRAGASLADVGQVLRHDRDQTTALYAAVDARSLEPLARPWPTAVTS